MRCEILCTRLKRLILFKSIKYKNFLSTGDRFTTILLNRTQSTLIVGQNGAGKSTMLDAISFALFGKPHRNINKPQLVNSINQKQCLVEVEFTVGKAEYKIVRGIKPGVFEIWQNGNMINQSSHSKEYQKILEQNILKLNHKTFHQVVVLGSSSFIPFMQLPAGHRREVIEDLLDINVFSKMNQLMREKNASLKDQTSEVSYQLDLISDKIETQKKYIKDVKALNKEYANKIEEEIGELEEEQNRLTDENAELGTFIESNSSKVSDTLAKLNSKQSALKEHEHELKSEIKKLVKETKFFEENTTCPTCSQDIRDELRHDKIQCATTSAKSISSKLSAIAEESAKTESDLEIATKVQNAITNKQHQLLSNNKRLRQISESLSSKRSDLGKMQNGGEDLASATETLESLSSQKDIYTEKRLRLSDQRSYNEVIGEMLKDTGIKTKIIKQYLPVINKLVNQYLQVLDFFVHFDLDESFQETIRSRHRDEFTYDSFSEGEKQRIDLALLFTWRQIAKMKNSISTNLLILDETFDSSLDVDGVENLLKILSTLTEDTNVFVISHKGDILDGKFRSKIC
jgi:DNA repair exonuclease SbcCD ATPase subunit